MNITVLSPHPDDAFISVSVWMQREKRKKNRVQVVTVFDGIPTADDVDIMGLHDLEVLQRMANACFHPVTGHEEGEDPAKKPIPLSVENCQAIAQERVTEDMKACEALGITGSSLGLVDSIFKPWRNRGPIVPQIIEDVLAVSLSDVVGAGSDVNLVLAPLACHYSTHVDHLATRILGQEISRATGAEILYYQDCDERGVYEPKVEGCRQSIVMIPTRKERALKKEALECYKVSLPEEGAEIYLSDSDEYIVVP